MANLELHYDFHALPSPSHKAGAVGLILAAEAFGLRVDATAGSLDISFTPEQFREFMSWFFQGGTHIDKDGKPKLEKPGKKKPLEEKKKGPPLVPAMPYFRKLCLDSADFWISRWQDYYSNYLRFTEKTVFSDKKPGHYDVLFKQLLKGANKTDQIDGRRNLYTYAYTAEYQAIRGFVQESFLLDFTLVSCLPCRVATAEWNAKLKKWDLKWPYTTIVVPEASDLRAFATRFADVLRHINGHELASYVVLPQQAALEFLLAFIHDKVSSVARHLNWAHIICLQRTKGQRTGRLCESVSQVPVDLELVQQYKNIRDELLCPPVRQEVLASLLNSEPWYSRLEKLLERYPLDALCGSFAHDMRNLFNKNAGEVMMYDEVKRDFAGDMELAKLLKGYVYWYLRNRLDNDFRPRTKMRANEDLKAWHNRVRKDWHKLASQAFASLRYSRGETFIQRFQNLFFEAEQMDTSNLGVRLLHDTNAIKTLTLAALSGQMSNGSVNNGNKDAVAE